MSSNKVPESLNKLAHPNPDSNSKEPGDIRERVTQNLLRPAEVAADCLPMLSRWSALAKSGFSMQNHKVTHKKENVSDSKVTRATFSGPGKHPGTEGHVHSDKNTKKHKKQH